MLTPDELDEFREYGHTRQDVKDLVAEIDRLTTRLEAAEAVCAAYGTIGTGLDTDREKALYELWWEWGELIGGDYRLPSDERITELARRRDAKRTEALKQSARLMRHSGEAAD